MALQETNGERKRDLEDAGAEPPPAKRRNRWDAPTAPAPAAEPPPAAQAALPSLPLLRSSVQAAKELAKEALAKAQRAADMQKAINAKMGSLVGLRQSFLAIWPGATRLAVSPRLGGGRSEFS